MKVNFKKEIQNCYLVNSICKDCFLTIILQFKIQIQKWIITFKKNLIYKLLIFQILAAKILIKSKKFKQEFQNRIHF